MSIHSAAPPALDDARGEPTSVYRYYDRDDVLIYVGITKQGMGRNLQHNGKAEWWPYVARQEIEHHPSRAVAMAREKNLIRKHRPPFNRQHNLDHEAFRAAYLHWASTKEPKQESAEKQAARLGRRLPLDIAECTGATLIFRSRLEHRPLASVVTLAGQRLPVWFGDDGSKVAHVESVERHGPFTLLICDAPSWTLPGSDDLVAHAVLSWRRDSRVAHLRRVVLRSAQGPVVG